jgi:sporulation protein YlmC with PRC-barrel domain
MRLTDLRHAIVRSTDGESLGRVYEVHSDNGRIIALMCGPGGFFERLTSRTEGRRIPWQSVQRIAGKEIVVASEAKTPSATQSRRGTRRTSGRRSKR